MFPLSTRLFLTVLLFSIFIQSSYSKSTSGLEILDDFNQINVQNASTSSLRVGISRKVVYVIKDQNGIDYLKNIELPYDFDPTYIYHTPAARKVKRAYAVVDLDAYSAHYMNGASIEIEKEDIDYEMATESDRYGEHDMYSLSLNGISVNDTIVLSYTYSFPMANNWVAFQSFRIFFNSDIPKNKYELRIGYPREVSVHIANYNGAKPDSITEAKAHRQFIYRAQNLSDCLNENGARPYTELPHVVINVKPISFRYDSHNTYETKELPSYALLASLREAKHLSMIQSIDQGLRLRQYNLFYSFMDYHTRGIENDTTAYLRLKKVKRIIADSLEFDNDVEYFKFENLGDPRFGQDLQDGIIRDTYRYETYIAVIRKLELGYFTAYISDKRCGVTDGNFLQPMDEDDYLLAVLTNDFRFHYIFPKRHDFGLYLDEFPFYHEHTRARLIHMKDYRAFARDINTQVRQLETPHSNFNDNKRTNHIMVNVDTENGLSSFKARLSLSGQYSTLCRGSYTKNYVDPTINQLYGKKIYDFEEDVQIEESEFDQLSYEFPFKASINANYSSTKLFDFSNGTSNVRLSELVTHVINEADCSEKRELDYYPDFLGADTYVYMLKFNNPVKLNNQTTEGKVQNDFGEVIFSIDQLNDNTIKISSFYAIKQSKLEAEQIDQLCDLQRSWHSFIDQELSLTIK